MLPLRPRLAVIAAAALLASGCASLDAGPDDAAPATSSSRSEDRGPTSTPTATETPVDPDTPTSWGPTVGEVEEARELVSTWTPEQLAGGVIVGRFHGTDPQEPARMVRELHLAGVSVTGDNVVDELQVRTMTAALAAAAGADGRDFPPVVGVDQEGGYVSHLRGVATEFPHFQSAGLAIEADARQGRRVTRAAALTTGLELRDLGFTWVFAPVADVTVGAADPTIGPRSPSQDPRTAAQAIGAAIKGYDDAGIVSTVKHFPGHGTATSDSHDTLPVVDSPLAEIEAHDLPPFESAIRQAAPAVMLSHLDLTAVAPGVPASMAPEVYSLLRDDMGFEGVAITDSMGMGAVAGRPKPALQALVAGADLLLMPVDTAVTHQVVVDGIASGEVSRERVEEAAARVVALQRWQARVAAQRPVPADVVERARAASADLLSAAY
ncbi:glycosyl hyrolase family 3 [Nocardioides sp. zg-1308]|uniref:glycoside hydrolase family 3 N-terminal domain-containing protein n=1 Tax=Nocardioides TaxID=1839 RepID=UPI0015538EEE|nr:glycoside hydrolase family 3 N-terminal domain-containing protein [Nocardioides sp. S-34]NPD06372.1 glycosyl hyrolase family 3 [Nocardioides sp. zg-1308]WQQ24161.1 glycoside hydrolase family 3 N-terminal domain-containing protein [Nocardioides sp. S-34]